MLKSVVLGAAALNQINQNWLINLPLISYRLAKWAECCFFFWSLILYAPVTETNPRVLLIPRALTKPRAKTSEYCYFSYCAL